MSRDKELLELLGNPSPSELQFVAGKLVTEYGAEVGEVYGPDALDRFDESHQAGIEAVAGYNALKLEHTGSGARTDERRVELRRMFDSESPNS